MLNPKGMRFPVSVILVCIRWDAAYPLSFFAQAMRNNDVLEKVTMDKSGGNKEQPYARVTRTAALGRFETVGDEAIGRFLLKKPGRNH